MADQIREVFDKRSISIAYAASLIRHDLRGHDQRDELAFGQGAQVEIGCRRSRGSQGSQGCHYQNGKMSARQHDFWIHQLIA